MRLLGIYPSDDSKKKYTAMFYVDDKIKNVSFGARGYEDYTMHKDKERMKRYQARHKNDNLDDPLSPGSLSWYILWTSTSIKQGIENYRRRFNL